MLEPLRITFRGMSPSEALESHIREKVQKLEHFYDRITGCHVTIEMSHKHQKGNIFHVKIELYVPHKVIAIHHEPEQNHAHEDVYVALRDAFDAAKRQLEDHVREMRADVKAHSMPTEQGA